MTTDRPNTTLAATIDQVLAEQLDPRAMAALLLEHGVRLGVICRVLAERGRRRPAANLQSPPMHNQKQNC